MVAGRVAVVNVETGVLEAKISPPRQSSTPSNKRDDKLKAILINLYQISEPSNKVYYIPFWQNQLCTRSSVNFHGESFCLKDR